MATLRARLILLKSQALRAKIAQTLPEYMLPRRIVFMETFPLTPNGKADRKALAAKLSA